MQPMIQAQLESWLKADGWPIKRLDANTWRTGFSVDGTSYRLFLKTTENWLVLTIVPFVRLPEDDAQSLATFRRMLELNQEMNLAKLAVDGRDVTLTVELTLEGIDWPHLKDGIDAITYYGGHHHAELSAMTTRPAAGPASRSAAPRIELGAPGSEDGPPTGPRPVVTLEALYEAILDAPGDDRPRRAYADAVAASDLALAEFIELQLLLARWRKAHLNPEERPAVSARVMVLRERHGERWGAPIDALVDAWAFGRGFVEYVVLDAGRFLATAPQLYRTAPILHLGLMNAKAHAAELFASPHLARIQALSLLRNQLGDAELELLAASPYLDALRWLSLANNEITAAGIETLAASERLGSLAYVNLDFNPGENPVPRFVDEYGGDTVLGRSLQARYGPRRWLSSEDRYEWPPERDAAD
jgi:hypothetical protein